MDNDLDINLDNNLRSQQVLQILEFRIKSRINQKINIYRAFFAFRLMLNENTHFSLATTY